MDISGIFRSVPGGGIKSIQRGTVVIGVSSTTGTATVTAVVVAKSFLSYLGFQIPTAGLGDNKTFARIDLTNTTTVTATRDVADADRPTVGFVLVEFF